MWEQHYKRGSHGIGAAASAWGRKATPLPLLLGHVHGWPRLPAWPFWVKWFVFDHWELCESLGGYRVVVSGRSLWAWLIWLFLIGWFWGVGGVWGGVWNTSWQTVEVAEVGCWGEGTSSRRCVGCCKDMWSSYQQQAQLVGWVGGWGETHCRYTLLTFLLNNCTYAWEKDVMWSHQNYTG